MKDYITKYKYRCSKCNYSEWISEDIIGEFAEIDYFCTSKSKMPILECIECNGSFKYADELTTEIIELVDEDELLF